MTPLDWLTVVCYVGVAALVVRLVLRLAKTAVLIAVLGLVIRMFPSTLHTMVVTRAKEAFQSFQAFLETDSMADWLRGQLQPHFH
jgi:hypothetical protein